MRDPNRIRKIKLIGAIGHKLKANIANDDSARDPENLTTYTAFGKIIDELEVTILDLSPTTGGTAGTYVINKLVPTSSTAGHYRWRGGLIDSAGVEDVRYEGPVHLWTRIAPAVALTAKYVTLGGNYITLGGNKITLSS